MPFSDATPLLEMLPGRQWRVAQGFYYTLPTVIEGLPAGLAIGVPAGTKTDLASVPRLVWPLIPPDGSYAPAAIVHDRLYRDHNVNGRVITRAQADGVLLAAMRELGTGRLTRLVIYAAVRVGAWWAWP